MSNKDKETKIKELENLIKVNPKEQQRLTKVIEKLKRIQVKQDLKGALND